MIIDQSPRAYDGHRRQLMRLDDAKPPPSSSRGTRSSRRPELSTTSTATTVAPPSDVALREHCSMAFDDYLAGVLTSLSGPLPPSHVRAVEDVVQSVRAVQARYEGRIATLEATAQDAQAKWQAALLCLEALRQAEDRAMERRCLLQDDHQGSLSVAEAIRQRQRCNVELQSLRQEMARQHAIKTRHIIYLETRLQESMQHEWALERQLRKIELGLLAGDKKQWLEERLDWADAKMRDDRQTILALLVQIDRVRTELQARRTYRTASMVRLEQLTDGGASDGDGERSEHFEASESDSEVPRDWVSQDELFEAIANGTVNLLSTTQFGGDWDEVDQELEHVASPLSKSLCSPPAIGPHRRRRFAMGEADFDSRLAKERMHAAPDSSTRRHRLRRILQQLTAQGHDLLRSLVSWVRARLPQDWRRAGTLVPQS